jgi:uncharacterized protein (DUF885 family)
MKVFLNFLFLSLFMVSCSTADKADDPKFNELSLQFLNEFWEHHPGHASSLGLIQYDKVLQIFNEETRKKRIQFYKDSLVQFQAVKDEDLSYSQRTDKKLILNELEGNIWSLTEFKKWQWDPSRYNIGTAVSSVLEKEKRPLEKRIQDISEKLQKVGEYYEVAKKNILKPTKEHTQLAVKQTRGLIEYLQKDVHKKIKSSKLSKADKNTALQRVRGAVQAAKKYQSFLKRVLSQPKAVGGFRSFRISPEHYAKKFEYDLQIETTPEELYKKALSTKEDIRSRMFETAILLYPKYFGEKLPPHDRQDVISSVIKKVSKSHAKPEEFVETVRKQIPELTKFIKEKDLLYLDPSRPLKVRETPLYQRGFAGASVDSPGPFDKGRDTFYNVTPLDNMSKKQKESYLREYNDFTLQILNIHEAIPGHYAQLVYSNKSPSLIKSIFRNGPTVEGWAVYAERMMLEQGYGENSPELWLMYYKWFLRVVTNTILDYEIHHKKISKKQGMKLMTEGAFQEKAEAEGKWNRATVSQVQLASYFAGFSEIYALREQIKEAEGDDFDLKEFHETFLSFGSAPVKEIKQLML